MVDLTANDKTDEEDEIQMTFRSARTGEDPSRPIVLGDEADASTGHPRRRLVRSPSLLGINTLRNPRQNEERTDDSLFLSEENDTASGQRGVDGWVQHLEMDGSDATAVIL